MTLSPPVMEGSLLTPLGPPPLRQEGAVSFSRVHPLTPHTKAWAGDGGRDGPAWKSSYLAGGLWWEGGSGVSILGSESGEPLAHSIPC